MEQVKITSASNIHHIPVGTVVNVLQEDDSSLWVEYNGQRKFVAPWECEPLFTMQSEAKVIERNDPVKFEADLNFYLSEGWKILSCSCGFVPSERYDFCADFKAILCRTTKHPTP
jgi:hypothetical protein